LRNPLAETYTLWNEIRDFDINHYPSAKEEWFISVKNMAGRFE